MFARGIVICATLIGVGVLKNLGLLDGDTTNTVTSILIGLGLYKGVSIAGNKFNG